MRLYYAKAGFAGWRFCGKVSAYGQVGIIHYTIDRVLQRERIGKPSIINSVCLAVDDVLRI